MKTLADLKRRLTKGQRLRLVYRYKKLDPPIEKKVLNAQSNGISLAKEIKDGKARGASWLFYPKASLLELTKKGFKIFSKGKRPLLPIEKEIMAGYEKTRNKEQEKVDMMTDGSTTYWQKVKYYKDRASSYLIGNKAERGMRYDYASGLVWDDRVKGDLCLEYLFV